MAQTNDHELQVGTSTERFELVRNDQEQAMYQVLEEVPQHRNPLLYEQRDWLGGHGQYAFGDHTVYFEGQSIDTTQPGKVFLGPLITEVKESDDTELDSAPVLIWWSTTKSKLFCATASKVYFLSSGKWQAAATTLAGVTSFADYKGFVYAAMGNTTKYYYSADGDTWTQTDLTDGFARLFLATLNASGSQSVLWKIEATNELSSTTDGRTVAAGGVQWSSPAYIGDTNAGATNLMLHNDNLLTGKDDGLYHYDSDGLVHPLLVDLRANPAANNFKYVAAWQAGLYFSLQTGMGEVTSYQAFEAMGPLTRIDDIGKAGTVVGLAADKDYIYAAVDEGTNTHIYKGREVRSGGRLRWEWCPWIFLGTNACAAVAVVNHSATDRRLWFSYGTHTGYAILTDNPLADSAARFAPSGFVRMSYDYGTDSNYDKLYQSAVIETTGGAPGETVQVQYRKDTDTSATECITAHTTNGVHEVNFIAALACKRIQFQINLASNTSTATPQVTVFQAKGVEKPTTVRIHEAYYALGDRPSDRVKTLRDFLRDARTSTNLIKFADLRYGQATGGTTSGDYAWCVMMPGYPKEVEVVHEKRRQPELAVVVRLQEVSYTVS